MIFASGINFGDLNLFNACFYWGFAGTIAGTVAHFVVRGRLGCLVGNLALGIVSALVANFLLNLFFQKNSVTLNFIEVTVIASITATLIAFIFHQARTAEGRYQQRLLDRSRQP